MVRETFTIKCDDLKSLISKLTDTLTKSFKSFSIQEIKENLYYLVYEQYFKRSSSFVMITIMINKVTDQKINIKIISGGGKAGIFHTNWNEKSSIEHFRKIINDFILSDTGEPMSIN